ncbi:MAG: hypothetical protein O3B41_00485 [Bacteroidetes bacterium]|nr:hypothetical protein [Bacteroidota bacterium]
MKIRIHDNHLRFRLSEAEVADLLSSGSISSEMVVGHSILGFSIYLTGSSGGILDAGPDKVNPTVELDHSYIKVEFPRFWTEDWFSNNIVGFEFDVVQPGHPNRDALTIIVEKDYPCAHTKEGKALFGKPVKMNPEG